MELSLRQAGKVVDSLGLRQSRRPLSPAATPGAQHLSSCSLQYLGIGVLLVPFFPSGDLVGNLRKESLEISSLNTHKTVLVRVPKSAGLFVVEHESILISPARRNERQCLAINLTAVQSR